MWKIKHENTAWHSSAEDDDIDVPDMDDIRGASHDAYLMNERITSETFRYKFLNYNRAWLVNQLPSMLTARTLKRSRPYLINQFSRILNQLNRDISSDSEGDTREFGPVALTAPSRRMIRWWLAAARKQVSQWRTSWMARVPSRAPLKVPSLSGIKLGAWTDGDVSMSRHLFAQSLILGVLLFCIENLLPHGQGQMGTLKTQ